MHYYACKPEMFHIFYKKENAILALLKTTQKQQDIFFYTLEPPEIMRSLISYYGNDFIHQQDQKITIQYFLKQESIIIHHHYIESESLDFLFDFLTRLHPIWIELDEKGQVCWKGLVNS